MDLIKITPATIGGEANVQTVNARELHEKLGSREPYSQWVQVQLARLRLIEGRDFVVSQPALNNPLGGRPRTDHHLTLDDDEKGTHTIRTPGGPQSVAVISESGLYSLILTSRKPEAKAFKKWVTSVVLPSIRKHGGYVAGQEKLATGELTDAELLARSILVAQRVIAEKDAKIAALAPKAAIVDEHMESFGRYSLSRFAPGA